MNKGQRPEHWQQKNVTTVAADTVSRVVFQLRAQLRLPPGVFIITQTLFELRIIF